MYPQDDDHLTEAEEYKKFWKVPPPAAYQQSPTTTTDPYSSTDYANTSSTYTKSTTTTGASVVPSNFDQDDEKPKPKVPWSTGLFDCFSDLNTCCITCWCPCITFGKIAEIVDKGSSSCGASGALYTLVACVTACACCYSCFYRGKMRQQYSLHKSPCGDCLVHCFCECCALCQEYRQLQFQGYDMAVGWHGNVERQRREAEMAEMAEMSDIAPTVEDGMSRSNKYN